MLHFTRADEDVVRDEYSNLVNELKTYLLSIGCGSPLRCASYIGEMIRAGMFSMTGVNKFYTRYDFLSCVDDVSNGVQVVYGACCCRHVSAFLNDVLREFGFSSKTLMVYVGDDGDWRRVAPAGKHFNHMVVSISEGEREYVVDLFNGFMLEVLPSGDLIQIPMETYEGSLSFDCKKSIQKIGTILKKYYTLKELGVNFVYDYSF